MPAKIRIGVIAPSSQVPPVECMMGVEQLEADGFSVKLHSQVRKSHAFFAGSDELRAQAFYDYAVDPSLPVLWCARGGYGSLRILPLLEKLVAERGLPERKLLVGLSDPTALMDYVRSRWGWSTLYGPMPGTRTFSRLTATERSTMLAWIRGENTKMPWGKKPLKFVGSRPRKAITAPVVGGTLAIWASLMGTPYEPQPREKILFFEDIGESLYRLDRMLAQIWLSGGLKGVKAIVLGNFEGCSDAPPTGLAGMPANVRARAKVLESPRPADLAPLRPRMDADKAIPKIVKEFAEKLGIPVAYGLPVGHGPGHASLPLGAQFRLGTDGSFELQQWDWLDEAPVLG